MTDSTLRNLVAAALASAFTVVSAQEPDTSSARVQAFAQSVQELARQTIKNTEADTRTMNDHGDVIRHAMKYDHTVLLGNNIGLISGSANRVLATHSGIPDRLAVCNVQDQETSKQTLDRTQLCLGNLKELGNFNLAKVDQGKVEAHRAQLLKLRVQ